MRRDPECVAVFGGAGNMGRLTVELFQRLGHQVLVVDPRESNSLTAADAIRSSGIIFFSVLPVGEIGGIISAHEGLFKGGIVLDNATVKRPFREAYERLCLRGEVAICSTHPLCKYDQPLDGQKALVMPVGDNATEALEIGRSLYARAGMQVIEFDFNKHDESMLIMQGLPHFLHRAVSTVFARMGLDMQSLQRIAPANFQLYALSMGRTDIQDPRISAMIVKSFVRTPEGQGILAQIEEAFREIIGGDEEELAAAFAETFSVLGGETYRRDMNFRTRAVLDLLAHLPESERAMETATSIGKSG